MTQLEHFLDTEDLHPIDLVESLAEQHEWDFDRVAEDQIAMAIEGQWRTYSITLAWSSYDETLRMVSTFEMEPPPERLPALYEVLNRANDTCWTGAFSYWRAQKLMVWPCRFPLQRPMAGPSLSPNQLGFGDGFNDN